MRFSEIIDYPRSWDSQRFPEIAHIEIDAALWSEFQRLADDQTQIRVLGHDLAANDQIVVHIACTSDDVRRWVESRWA